MTLTLRQDLVVVADDGKGKHQSWEAAINFDDTGINFCLYAYGESEQEARSNLELKFQELIQAVSEQSN